MNNPICILCGNPQNTSFRFAGTESEILMYHECSNKSCGLISQYPYPTDDKLRPVYSPAHYSNWGDYYKNRDTVRKRKKIKYNQPFIKFDIKPGLKVLDCKCADGVLLELGIEKGWDIYGIDTNPAAIEESKEIAGKERVFHKQLDTLHFAESSFDALCMFNYIEHQADPHETLKQALRLLKPNAFLYLTTPDTSHPLRKVLKQYWPHYQREHIHLFSKRNIIPLLKPGFEIVHCGSFKKVFNSEMLVIGKKK